MVAYVKVDRILDIWTSDNRLSNYWPKFKKGLIIIIDVLFFYIKKELK